MTIVVSILTVTCCSDRIHSTLRYFVRVVSIGVLSSRCRTMKGARISFGSMHEGMTIIGAFCSPAHTRLRSMSVERDIRFDLIARLCPNTTGAELRSVATEVCDSVPRMCGSDLMSCIMC